MIEVQFIHLTFDEKLNEIITMATITYDSVEEAEKKINNSLKYGLQYKDQFDSEEIDTSYFIHSNSILEVRMLLPKEQSNEQVSV